MIGTRKQIATLGRLRACITNTTDLDHALAVAGSPTVQPTNIKRLKQGAYLASATRILISVRTHAEQSIRCRHRRKPRAERVRVSVGEPVRQPAHGYLSHRYRNSLCNLPAAHRFSCGRRRWQRRVPNTGQLSAIARATVAHDHLARADRHTRDSFRPDGNRCGWTYQRIPAGIRRDLRGRLRMKPGGKLPATNFRRAPCSS